MSIRTRACPWPVLVAAAVSALPSLARAQVAPYSPYADSRPLAPVAADGTIQWGAFHKSPAIQRKYEYLWSIGACRGTAAAIVAQVSANKVSIDALPEAEFVGTVRGVAGGLPGGVVAFVEAGKGDSGEPPLVAQLHPAGVTRFRVSGRAGPGIVRPGMTVRFTAVVDARGFAREPLAAFDVISPAQSAPPTAVVAGEPVTVVGTVTRATTQALGVRVGAGRIRNLSIPLAADAVATVEATTPDLVTAGDTIKVTGRIWTGEGAMGAGTVFASDVSVHKAEAAPGGSR